MIISMKYVYRVVTYADDDIIRQKHDDARASACSRLELGRHICNTSLAAAGTCVLRHQQARQANAVTVHPLSGLTSLLACLPTSCMEASSKVESDGLCSCCTASRSYTYSPELEPMYGTKLQKSNLLRSRAAAKSSDKALQSQEMQH